MQLGTLISRVTLDADRVISASSVRVHGVCVSNAAAVAVEVVFEDNSGIPLLNIVVPALDSRTFEGPWLADNGLNVLGLGDADIVVTVIHSQPGA